MPTVKALKTHRTWEDMLGMCLGAAIWFTARPAELTHTSLVLWNTIVVGLLVLTLASVIHDTHARGKELAEAALGLWLIASPFVFGYAAAGTLRYWHFALGALVTLLAVLELAQDWSKDAEAPERAEPDPPRVN